MQGGDDLPIGCSITFPTSITIPPTISETSLAELGIHLSGFAMSNVQDDETSELRLCPRSANLRPIEEVYAEAMRTYAYQGWLGQAWLKGVEERSIRAARFLMMLWRIQSSDPDIPLFSCDGA